MITTVGYLEKTLRSMGCQVKTQEFSTYKLICKTLVVEGHGSRQHEEIVRVAAA